MSERELMTPEMRRRVRDGSPDLLRHIRDGELYAEDVLAELLLDFAAWLGRDNEITNDTEAQRVLVERFLEGESPIPF